MEWRIIIIRYYYKLHVWNFVWKIMHSEVFIRQSERLDQIIDAWVEMFGTECLPKTNRIGAGFMQKWLSKRETNFNHRDHFWKYYFRVEKKTLNCCGESDRRRQKRVCFEFSRKYLFQFIGTFKITRFPVALERLYYNLFTVNGCNTHNYRKPKMNKKPIFVDCSQKTQQTEQIKHGRRHEALLVLCAFHDNLCYLLHDSTTMRNAHIECAEFVWIDCSFLSRHSGDSLTHISNSFQITHSHCAGWKLIV